MSTETWSMMWFSPDEKTPLVEEIEAYIDEHTDVKGLYLLTAIYEHCQGNEWRVDSRSLLRGMIGNWRSAYGGYGTSLVVRGADGKLARPSYDEEPVIPSRIDRTRDFMIALVRSGVSYEQASHEGYRFVLALLSDDRIQSEQMHVAASLAEEAAKEAGIHSTQLRAALYESSEKARR